MRIASPTLPPGFGDLDATLDAVVHGEHANAKDYDSAADYGIVKLIGTAWMKHLADEHGLRALSVSPGFTGGTSAMKDLPFLQRLLNGWIVFPILRLVGSAHNVRTGAARYVQALEERTLEAGGFYASAKGGMSGPITLQTAKAQPLLADQAFHAAVTRLVARLVEEEDDVLQAAG